MMILAQDVLTSKSMKRPKPRVITVIPNQIIGRYCPVFLIKTPVNAERNDRESAVGSRYTPERIGVAPRTAWK